MNIMIQINLALKPLNKFKGETGFWMEDVYVNYALIKMFMFRLSCHISSLIFKYLFDKIIIITYRISMYSLVDVSHIDNMKLG